MKQWAILFVVVTLSAGCVSVPQRGGPPGGAGPEPRTDRGPALDPDCEVRDFVRSDGLVVWSPAGDQYVLNKKDAAGIYQLYVGAKGGGSPACITCSERKDAPGLKRHKLQPHWHPSGKWILLAAEREEYKKPLIHTPKLIEGWILSGLFVNMYATRPDGSQWHRLSDFGGKQRGDGFIGVLFTPDGKQGVWAQIIDGNVFQNLFGRWELVIADFVEENGVPSLRRPRDISPAGARWLEPGNFAPDGRSLVITADIGMRDPQGQDQFILDVVTGRVHNLTNSPAVWDEHGVFSPDGEKVFYMSSHPFRTNQLKNTLLALNTELMLMTKDGRTIQQLSYFNTPGYPESNPAGKGSVAAGGEWHPDGQSISVLNLFFPEVETWTLTFKGPCGMRLQSRAR